MTDIDHDVRVFGTFYKYREFPATGDAQAWSRLETTLLKREIFFPSPTDLNDPFDCSPRIDLGGDPDHIRRKAADLLAEIAGNRGVRITPSDRKSKKFEREVSNLVEQLRSEQFRGQALADSVGKKTGIYCMSKKNDSILQWSYYGGGHGGVCLEFTVPQNAPAPFDQVVPIEYVSDRQSVDLFDVIDRKDRGFLWQMVRRKYRDWDHEQEVRAFAPAPGLRIFAPEFLTGIIFGSRACGDHIQWTREHVEKGGLKVNYFRAVQSYSHFALDIQPLAE